LGGKEREKGTGKGMKIEGEKWEKREGEKRGEIGGKGKGKKAWFGVSVEMRSG